MPRSPVLMLLVFALTLFASATLLFMVEPMIGKMILPLLGGTPAVWNTCMVFFQAVLLLGYGYAHLSTTWLGARKQAALHLVLLALPFVVLPVAVNQKLIKGDENPVFLVLLILSLTVGLPMFVVSASAPLLQKWFASTSHPAAKDPYFLYGASNLGSMLTLIAYPLVVEPNLRLDQQSFDWTIGYGVLVTLTAACAVLMWLSPRNVETVEKVEEAATGNKASEAIQPSRQAVRTDRAIDRPPQRVGVANFGHDQTLTGAVTWMRILRWVALAFVPSSLMLGATTYITTDIAAIPLLWVAPLALYLLSFILVFSKPAFQWGLMVALNAGIALILAIMVWNGAIDPTYAVFTRRLAWAFVGLACGSAGGGLWSWKKHDSNLQHRVMILILPLLVLALLFFMLSEIKTKSHWIGFILSMHLVTLFVVSMVCHGELARDRPAAKDLTGYFLWMSVGGVLGGLFNGLLAPLIFNGIVEYELAMMLACFLAPPLGPSVGSKWGRRADLILAGLFVMIAAVLIALRLRDHDLTFEALTDSPWPWQLVGLLLGLMVAAGVAVRAPRQKVRSLDGPGPALVPGAFADRPILGAVLRRRMGEVGQDRRLAQPRPPRAAPPPHLRRAARHVLHLRRTTAALRPGHRGDPVGQQFSRHSG